MKDLNNMESISEFIKITKTNELNEYLLTNM